MAPSSVSRQGRRRRQWSCLDTELANVLTVAVWHSVRFTATDPQSHPKTRDPFNAGTGAILSPTSRACRQVACACPGYLPAHSPIRRTLKLIRHGLPLEYFVASVYLTDCACAISPS